MPPSPAGNMELVPTSKTSQPHPQAWALPGMRIPANKPQLTLTATAAAEFKLFFILLIKSSWARSRRHPSGHVGTLRAFRIQEEKASRQTGWRKVQGRRPWRIKRTKRPVAGAWAECARAFRKAHPAHRPWGMKRQVKSPRPLAHSALRTSLEKRGNRISSRTSCPQRWLCRAHRDACHRRCAERPPRKSSS